MCSQVHAHKFLYSALGTTQEPCTDHKRHSFLDSLRILKQPVKEHEVRRRASPGRGRYSLGAGSRIGFVKRSYTASALAISFFALWALQVVLYFIFDSLPNGSRALNLALP